MVIIGHRYSKSTFDANRLTDMTLAFEDANFKLLDVVRF